MARRSKEQMEVVHAVEDSRIVLYRAACLVTSVDRLSETEDDLPSDDLPAVHIRRVVNALYRTAGHLGMPAEELDGYVLEAAGLVYPERRDAFIEAEKARILSEGANA